MMLLNRLSLRIKLTLLLGLALLAVAGATGYGALGQERQMLQDRVLKVRAVVDASLALAAAQQRREAAGQLTREQAIEAFRTEMHALRFDAGEGYVTALSAGKVVIHGAAPAREGEESKSTDADGTPLTTLIERALQGADGGVISYMTAKPGQTTPQPKVSYVGRFAPWNMVLLAGDYTDDLQAAFRALLWNRSLLAGGIFAVTLAFAWMVNRDISGSLGGLKAAMQRLAEGELATDVPGAERRDEVGAMAKAVEVFKRNAVERARLQAAQQEMEQHAESQKRRALMNMAETIERETKSALEQIGTRTTRMASLAEGMTASAGRTGASAQNAAVAAGQALANAQTVASAAEELASSIREIGGQVHHSTEVVGKAVAASTETRATIAALNEQVGRIGAVADMIGDIAGKTNLLALNATIEAARAGEAGKGFAVVASEVKQLANQTARSTEEITRHIAEVRAATGASVEAVARIEQTITEISEIAGSIAAAVEEQGAATAEIARNVTETASAANAMTSRTGEVSEEAEQTGRRAAEVLDHTTTLDRAVGELKESVIRVVRTATSEVDRREAVRHDIDRPCRLSVAGQVHTARVVNLSEGGAAVHDAPAMPAGTHGSLTLDGVGFPLPFTVRENRGGVLHLGFDLDAATAERFRPLPERLARHRAA